MNNHEHQVGETAKEKAAIARSGRLHWYHWLVIVLSFALTITAWQVARHQAEEKTAVRFQRASEHVVELVAERMRKYELALWAGVAAIQAQGGDIDRRSWRTFANSLRIDVEYPGINGIGVIHHVPPERLTAYLEEQRRLLPDYRIHPGHDKNVFMPITYVEPAERNAEAIGLDMAHEANRFGAALQARDSGMAQITSPIVLVQDAGRTPGFLFYAPFYAGGPAATLDERRKQFTGMVYAPFVVHKLMEGVLDKDKRLVRIRLREGDSLLYDELVASDPQVDSSSALSTTKSLDLYGKTWTFDIETTRSFGKATADWQPTAVLIGGLVIEVLLVALFVMLAKANRVAYRMAVTLADRTEQLERSNEDLENFAYVTSHDLKTPLRGISDLIDYLEEDLEPYLESADACSDVQTNLQRLRQQTSRMDGLIRGILDYSSIGTAPPEPGHAGSSDIVLALRQDLGLREEQIQLKGVFPTVTVDVVRFQQVMANLVGNALKYHNDPERATVTVTASETDGFHEFSVCDDGPGIDPRFHDRIFGVFQSLQTRDDVESTGIGLSIVKKAVESHGGRVSVKSAVGEGATFTFQWPKGMTEEQRKAA